MTCLLSYDVIIVLETASCLEVLSSKEVGGSFWRFFFELGCVGVSFNCSWAQVIQFD